MGRHRLSLDKKWLKELHLSSKTLLKNFQNSKPYRWLDYRNYQGLERTLHSVGLLAMTGLLLFSAISPLVDIYVTHKYYSLNSSTSGLVGSVSDTLAKQITYDNAKNAYVFNAAGMTPSTQVVGPDKVPLALLQAKVAGNKSKSKSTYSVVMPTDPKAGISYYDSNTGLSFQLVPNFTEMSAQQVNNHIVYPVNNDLQMVYSVKNNGLKEDIILKQYVSDSLSFSYSLKLPKTLEARLLTDGSGSLGIYSADPSLFNNATTGPDYDSAKIESAQLHAQKDHLVFAVPAPVIKQAGQSGQGSANAYFRLSPDGQTLTVSANNLRGLHYPVTVDPTVVITSTADFATGNNEDGNITYPAGQINRGSLTGGSVSGGWTATTVLPAATYAATSVVYNGYVYEIGGYNGTTAFTTVSYAPLNANGTVGAWTATTSLTDATYYATSVAYNGYVYEIGGYNGTAAVATVYYAPINANGTLGAWTATTALPIAVQSANSVAYNGYIYKIGGWTGTAAVATVYYAPINANGTLGAWTATTALPAATNSATSVIYNGYVYEIGGYNGTAAVATVSYAPINANGTLGAWTATTSLPVATYGATSVVYNGYVYESGGWMGAYIATVYYAPINANGTLGAWTATTSLTAASYVATSVVYNGYLYEIGGFNGTAAVATVSYAKIDPAGVTTAYTSTTALPSVTNMASSVAYNGYVYEIAGNNPSISTTVLYAPINTNGTIGSWTATTALPSAAYGATAVAYNGYLYEIGGYNAGYVSTVYYAPINTNGTIGSWTATTALPTGNFDATSVVYNGYLYVIGGQNGTGEISIVDYAPINANGTVGTWTATTSLPGNRNAATSAVYNGYIYEIGGRAAGTYYTTVYYAPINANGTIGAWTATTSLPTGLAGATAAVYNSYIYEIGGLDATLHYNNVSYAPINANGTVGTWTATAALPNLTAWATSVVYGGYLYEIGGDTGAVSLNNVYYAAINNGGAGTVGAWTATTALSANSRSSTSVAYNGYLYNIGGNNGATAVSTVYYAVLNTNGTVGTWTATTALPIAVFGATSVVYNGYIYEIGGNTGPSAVTNVYYAPINSNGTLGNWTATTSLPLTTYFSSSVVYNGYIYEIGGDNPTASTIVDYAHINADGTIGAWTATTPLPVGIDSSTAVVYNGYLYEIGGATSVAVATVYYASINVNGTIGAWNTTTNLPVANYSATSIAYNGYLYEIGGLTSAQTTIVLRAPINANGTIGDWNSTAPLLSATQAASSVVYNGYLYEIGGLSPTAVATVSYAPLNVMPRVGHYSSLFSFNSPITPVSLSYNGSLPNAYGLSSIQYRTAGSNGVFGANQLSTVINGSATSCTPGSAQYLEATLTLDDSGSAGFPDVNATSANVTDFTLTYATAHPQPNLRLRGGKFFISNALQPLDSCRQVPNAPTIGTATAGNQSATVTFTDNAAGDSPITSHTVTSSPGGLTGTGSSPVTVSGLTPGVNYTFTVTATSLIGTSVPSTVSNTVTIPPVVTGGTLTADATYYYRTFTSSGTFGITGGSITADVLIIGGGGGGGNSGGGGGGAGYVNLLSNYSIASGSYSITVGAGGAGGTNNTTGNATIGGTSSAFGTNAVGGGPGGGYQSNAPATGIFANGGGGGNGQSGSNGTSSTGNAGTILIVGTTHNGYSGGGVSPTTTGNMAGHGGAGATQNGAGATGNYGTSTVASTWFPGNGGAGTSAFSAWATATGTGVGGYYAGGGAGGYGSGSNGAVGGAGGGGSAPYPNASASLAGIPNTGGGGAGSGGTTPDVGGAGGSGIVIIRYLKTAVAPQTTTPTVDYLIVAGGGAGATIDAATNNASGAGGAGGLLTATGYGVVPGTAYTVTVGAGGAQSNTLMNNGGNSIFNGITATGGGAGANYHISNTGANGGSGGGGRVSTAGGNGVGGQGNNGGAGFNQGGGGGGGGATGVGGTASTVNGAVGGAGYTSSISGSSVTYAGGGGGGSASTGTGGAGGSGGGGAGATYDTNATNGTANTGGGGGGAGGTSGAVRTGGSGGSGIVIIRYPNTYPDATATTGSPTYANIGGYKIYTFTNSGSITF